MIYNKDICPRDIEQGFVGNCYFLAVLSACAEQPYRITDRFKIKEINKAGIYLVTMFVNGKETPIILDDWFPIHMGKPAFCRTNAATPEIWGMLLEKAWAKLHGSYMRTHGGLTAHAAQHMVGLPSFHFNHKKMPIDNDKFWTKLCRWDEYDFVMLS